MFEKKKEEKRYTSFMCEDDWCTRMIGEDGWLIGAERKIERYSSSSSKEQQQQQQLRFLYSYHRKARRDNFF